jgi:hypothetical protein
MTRMSTRTLPGTSPGTSHVSQECLTSHRNASHLTGTSHGNLSCLTGTTHISCECLMSLRKVSSLTGTSHGNVSCLTGTSRVSREHLMGTSTLSRAQPCPTTTPCGRTKLCHFSPLRSKSRVAMSFETLALRWALSFRSSHVKIL